MSDPEAAEACGSTDDRAGAGCTEEILAAMRSFLERVARPFGDTARRLDVLLGESAPFVEYARRALTEETPTRSTSWREARSMAWLLAYRLGDQGWPAHVVAAIVPAWRQAIGTEIDASLLDELTALMMDGYARGREDRTRTEGQKSLAAALPVVLIAPHVVLIVAAGPLDPEGARTLADRASAFMLRHDARGALLDIEGLVAPTAAVVAELWSITASARMLGVRMVVSGVRGAVGELLRNANVRNEGETRVESLTEGMDTLLQQTGVALGQGLGSWLRQWMRRGRHRGKK